MLKTHEIMSILIGKTVTSVDAMSRDQIIESCSYLKQEKQKNNKEILISRFFTN